MITSPNVTIDLNGFTILESSTLSDTSDGIRNNGIVEAIGITVRNGNIEGFADPLHFFAPVSTTNPWAHRCQACVFDHLSMKNPNVPLSRVIQLGGDARVTNVTAPRYRIEVFCPSLVVNAASRSVRVDNPGNTSENPGTCTFEHIAKIN